MTLSLTREAQAQLDGYLRELRFWLRGCRSLEREEVERDILDHIQRDLEGESGPVSEEQLQTVLRRLGSPRDWVPEEELPWWRKVMMQLYSGPEDWRLAYLTLGLLLISFLTPLFLFASFLLARATISEVEARGETLGPRRWLIYPSLVVVYIGLAGAILFFPVGPVIGLLDTSSRLGTDWPLIPAVLGAWWLVAGVTLQKLGRLMSIIFHPFAAPAWLRHVLLISGVCLFILGAGLSLDPGRTLGLILENLRLLG